MVELSSADTIGHGGECRDWTDYYKVNSDINRDEQNQESQNQVEDERSKCFVGDSDRHGHGHRDDLRSHDFAILPPEAVVGAVSVHERDGRASWDIVALHAGGFDGDRMSQVESGPCGGTSFSDDLLAIGIVAEGVNDVRLEIFGAIARIGRIESGFSICVLGVARPKARETLRGSVGGHGLWNEYGLVAWDLVEEWLQFLRGVVARSTSAFHHELRLLDDLCPRILHQEAVSNARDESQPYSCNDNENQIELNEQLQLSPRETKTLCALLHCAMGKWTENFARPRAKTHDSGVDVIGDGVEKNSGTFVGNTIREHGIDDLLDIVLHDVGMPGHRKADAPLARLTSIAMGAAKAVAGGAVPRAVKLVAKGYGFTGGVVRELMLAELNGHGWHPSPGVCLGLLIIVLNGLQKWTFRKLLITWY
jgi:hypothetical protein